MLTIEEEKRIRTKCKEIAAEKPTEILEIMFDEIRKELTDRWHKRNGGRNEYPFR